ncbi:ATP phosphoribosyltransferase [Pelagibacterium halotolerans]|uniref:ATP phosphoribosyltransferase n=1 Tax=Pelagibacterium halotolerans (strain DSM 22347 / JCM 15775 / CGMCC 1.7692 / B2) TaxID=1082931 RepID=G4RAD7_PELHB|nr:ATP phosphoribosyltransferase [Pelagibacterium halotolerans]AEQ50496.1 ATP phosphoribosyltransferase catalytic subunit [Pelagibacterium halotolerans B2]QJR19549.1 ATP phosphoribosyltransferase [Pelagibacterium halotolerans]SDZ88327.1 ATP phosphoribosyltransferase [Pelagibacterium halotolerans]
MSSIMLALPSKGRIQQEAIAVFEKAGLSIERPGGARSYLGEMAAMPDVVVRFLSASEIARELIRGTIDIGITGEDLIHETAETGPQQVEIVKRLGFGRADAVVAVPDSWIDVTTMDDLSDVAADFRARHGRWLRIATKFVNLTRRHFAAHGIAEYRIVESLGATEAAPASGAADLIVDITSTGATLKANGLRILEDGVMLKSESLLLVARNAQWHDGKLAVLTRLADAIGATRFQP